MNESLIDWSGCALVEVIPGKHSGDPLLIGTRIPADAILSNLESGASVEEIAEYYPRAGVDRIKGILEYARSKDLRDVA